MRRKVVLSVVVALLLVGAWASIDMRIPHDNFHLARTQLSFVAHAIEQYRGDNGVFPPSLTALSDNGPSGLGPYLKAKTLRDPWGRDLYYGLDPDGRGFTVFTLGRDGRIGGRGADADLSESSRLPVEP